MPAEERAAFERRLAADPKLRAEMEQAVRDVVKIETATEPRFQELFVAAMAFPHATAPTTNLAHLVALPERVERADRSDGARARRRRRQEGAA